MRASVGTYEKVAENCSEFSPSERGDVFTSSSSAYTSCANCKHFSMGEYCRLDLYDQIHNRLETNENYE